MASSTTPSSTTPLGRSTLFTPAPAVRRREPSFPSLSQTRGSSSLATPAAGGGATSPTATGIQGAGVGPGGAWGTTTLPSAPSATGTAVSSTTGDLSGTNGTTTKKKGPSLSFATTSLSSSDSATKTAKKGDSNGTSKIHPLKYTWDVWFAHRNATGVKGGKIAKDEIHKVKIGTNGGKEKESKEEWEERVVKLGGFSSVESLHPFLAYLTSPSGLPASANSTATLFNAGNGEEIPPVNNVVSDINIFKSPIAPFWEDPHNTGGGKWVLKLRKGVADRVWEEVIFALVGERIGAMEDDKIDVPSAGTKVTGVVLSVRKDEDILSLWIAPSTRTERDAIRDSFKAVLAPLLTPAAASNLSIDYKPHPTSNSIIREGGSAGPIASGRERDGTAHPGAHFHRGDRDSHRGERDHYPAHRGDRESHGGFNNRDRPTERSENPNGSQTGRPGLDRPPRTGYGSYTRIIRKNNGEGGAEGDAAAGNTDKPDERRRHFGRREDRGEGNAFSTESKGFGGGTGGFMSRPHKGSFGPGAADSDKPSSERPNRSAGSWGRS